MHVFGLIPALSPSQETCILHELSVRVAPSCPAVKHWEVWKAGVLILSSRILTLNISALLEISKKSKGWFKSVNERFQLESWHWNVWKAAEVIKFERWKGGHYKTWSESQVFVRYISIFKSWFQSHHSFVVMAMVHIVKANWKSYKKCNCIMHNDSASVIKTI